MAWLKPCPDTNHRFSAAYESHVLTASFQQPFLLLRIRLFETMALFAACSTVYCRLHFLLQGLRAFGTKGLRILRVMLSSGKGRRHGRIRALLLIVSVLLPLAQLALSPSQTFESTLPACCRAHGKHHCALSSQSHEPARQIAQVSEKCPCPPALPSSTANQLAWSISLDDSSFRIDENGEALDGTTVYRTASPERSNPKRGPPNSSIFA
jgi:hypothetical protein